MAVEDKLREYLKRATAELTEARRRLAEVEEAAHEPIAVIGMSARYPGADSVPAYWSLLREGRSGVRDGVPDGRFRLDPYLEDGSVYTTRGAFLDDITRWDARFFGFSPREALRMDPQQRLLMELAWEALEDSGLPAPTLAGSRTGVLVGFSDTFQYGRLAWDREHADAFQDPLMGQGASASVVAGRLAYHFDLRGPTMTVDTACSSSLVAVHLARQALQRGDCDLAIAGGASLTMRPDAYVYGCATSMFSRQGNCATFDASADGYVIGEGGGIVVLARLSDALRDGHRIHAVIRGTAINQDGRSNGLTAPNRAAQIDVIRRAHQEARVEAARIDYVEAHGSATPLGDQIELAALETVFGGRATALPVGAVKTNIGHTQAAAGIAGLIKTVLVLENGEVPANLNQQRPAEAVGSCRNVRPAGELEPLPEHDRPHLAGVSSFGWCGSNAHVVLEAAPATTPAEPVGGLHVLPVSAAAPAALGALVTRLADDPAAQAASLHDLAHTLQSGRTAQPVRRAVVASSTGEALRRLASAGAAPVVAGRTPIGFELPADDAPGAGGELFETEPAFAAAVRACDQALGSPLSTTMFDAGATGPLAAFTRQYALAQLLASVGVTAASYHGRGIGALVAEVLDGRADLAEALRRATVSVPAGDDVDTGDTSVRLGRPTDSELAVLPADGGSEREAFLTLCAALWERGVAVDWSRLRAPGGRPVSLPPYPFQRERYWAEPEAPEEAGTTVEVLVPRWAEAVPPVPSVAGDLAGRRIRLEGVTTDLGPELADRLRAAGAELVTDDADLIVDLTPLTTADDLVEPVLAAAGRLARWGAGATTPVDLVVVTRGGRTTDRGEVSDPAPAAVAALALVAGQEYPQLRARSVDVDPASTTEQAAAALITELTVSLPPSAVAYRSGRRLEPAYVEAPTGTGPTIEPGGRFLITGGLGTIGLTIARHLARRGAAQLVLTSRRGASHDDPRLTGLRALGVEVLTPAVDVTDPAAVRDLLAGLELSGVVHAAADTGADAFRALGSSDRAVVARHFGAKVTGAQVLAATLAELPAERRPAWVQLLSSTSALLGGLTFGPYAAANAALTAIASQTDSSATRWISVAWDTWACTLARLEGGFGAGLAEHAMTDDQALAAFDRALARPEAAVVVAAGGLASRLGARAEEPVEPTEQPINVVRHPRPELPQPYAAPMTDTQRRLASVWSDLLGIEPVGVHDNYFDLGGTSLLVPVLFKAVAAEFGVTLPTVTLFESPTVRTLAQLLEPTSVPAIATAPAPVVTPPVQVRPRPAAPEPEPTQAGPDRRIAIIGHAGRFPGAQDVETFWANLTGSVESITFFTPDELRAAGVDEARLADPAYVPARAVLDDIAGFDAGFFGISPRMAALTDPQQRLFLEVCWESLEAAGYAQPGESRGRVGVFGGTHISTYLLGLNGSLGDDVDPFELGIGNEKDALTTNVSYLFDLHGPSVAVQTFCSTSLVAAHLAVQSLRAGDCEIALAGGVSIRVPDRVGHTYLPGGMESPDGHVRTFDAGARGSMFGDGAAVVVLKRLEDALRDGDHVWGVIRGSAMNNDGARKVGFTAPSVTGQARVVRDAMRDAGVGPDDIGFVEAHGSGTPMGDPIEVAALTQAYGPDAPRQAAALGAVKTNIGHLDRAAGGAGLIKTSLAVHHGVIPATLHFTEPNPEIDFAGSPFFVNDELIRWPGEEGRRRIAGLNSLGMGGTNVHMVVEEPPARADDGPEQQDPATTRRSHVLPFSARTASAADATAGRLAAHLAARPDLALGDVAYTLQAGRKVFEHRRVTVASGLAEAVATLGGQDGAAPAGRVEAAQDRGVAFLLTGVGEQYPGLVGEIYQREPVFRSLIDPLLTALADMLGEDAGELADLVAGPRPERATGLAALLGRATAESDPRSDRLQRTELVQPLLFAVDHALASTLMAWGVEPRIMLGYSLGEYVAACLAGVLSPQDALALVVHRARLISGAEGGRMIGVQLGAGDLRERFDLEARGLDIAAVNGPQTSVAAGPRAAVEQLLTDLRAAGVAARELRTTHAFHTRMLAPLAAGLTAWVAENITLNPPTRPYISNVTGGPADAALVRDPGYWARHMCEPVQFAAGLEVLLADPELAVLEIGPGQSLSALARGGDCPPSRWPMFASTLPGADDPRPADAVLSDALARLWLLGVEIDWAAHQGRRAGTPGPARRPGRVPLPTYPFERQRYWIEPTRRGATVADGPEKAAGFADLGALPRLPEENWLNLPVWRQSAPTAPAAFQPGGWLVLAPDHGRAGQVLARLREACGDIPVIAVRPGDELRLGDDYTARPGEAADLLAVLTDLRARGVTAERVVHLWTLDDDPGTGWDTVALGLHTLVALARSAGELGLTGWQLDIVTSGSRPVLHGDPVRPPAATLTGPAVVLPLEHTTVTTRLIDADPFVTGAAATRSAGEIVAELRRPPAGPTVALRNGRRWLDGWEPIPAPTDEESAAVLRPAGVYLVTGGLGGIGLAMAENLARDCRARLVLLGRTGLPPRDDWEAIRDGARPADAAVRERVGKLLRIVELGGEVEIVVGDVTDRTDVRRAVETARTRFGGLHGVLHAAGIPGTGLMQFARPADADAVIAPKIAGTEAIWAALDGGAGLDFLALFSSIATVTGGGPGQVGYCAGNAYLDARAAQLAAEAEANGSGLRVISVDWGEWAWNAWDAGLSGYDADLGRFFREHRERFGIAFEEGWRTLRRAIATGEPRLVAATQALPEMIRISKGFTVEAAVGSAGAPAGDGRHPRPELVTPYQEPEGEAEEKIADVWCRALRLQRVGARDNFFDLGGSSLLGLTLLATIREAFPGAELPPHVLHEAPTVAELARIATSSGEPAPEPSQTVQNQAARRRSGLRAVAARRSA